jgi:hypothetical protein
VLWNGCLGCTNEVSGALSSRQNSKVCGGCREKVKVRSLRRFVHMARNRVEEWDYKSKTLFNHHNSRICGKRVIFLGLGFRTI